ncbi:MAG: hypothetical protein LBE59_05675 [Nevskiaceae bacterium]|jgi:polysaccharide chain length determinant protein (PEP-CTERM system associated)|nr:hypothetical protein [Nevskiaceae bacterium]
MKEVVVRLYDEARSAWRYRWLGLALAAGVALLGWAAVFALPDRYEAAASLSVDATALRPYVTDFTVAQDVVAQLNRVGQSLLSGPSLERIARTAGLLTDDVVDQVKVAGILQGLASGVTVEVEYVQGNAENVIFSFAYQDAQRDRAIDVIETVKNAFIEDVLGQRREGSENAQKFLEEEIRSYEVKLSEAETRLADFKKANIGLMPTEQGGYFGQMQAELDAAAKLRNDLKIAEARRAELNRQSRGEAAISAATGVTSTGGAIGGSDTLTRIKDTQARIDDLLQRFTEKHPDVIAARNTLRELNERREAEIQSLRRGDAGAAAASGASLNPVYQNIMLQLNQVEVEIASLRNQLVQHEARAAQLRERLDVAPQVEAEYAQLNRDYDFNKAQYTTLLANYEKARLGERADNAGSVRFDVVKPTTAPFGPVSPARLLMLAGVFIVAAGAGGALCYGLHLLNPVIGSLSGLQEMLSVPVLGVVSSAFPDRLRAETRSELLRFAGAFSVLVVGLLVAVMLSRLGVRFHLGGAG